MVAAGNAGNATPAGGFLAGAALYDGVRGSMIVVGALDATDHMPCFSQTPGNTCMMQSGQTLLHAELFRRRARYQILSSVGGGG